MSRQVTLNAVQAGMTRLRDKGGANPGSLYDLTNGYVTAARTMRSRPGTDLAHELPEETKGLCVYRGELWTFSHQPQSMAGSGGVKLALVRHPTSPNLALQTIHFAAPFLGYLYVAAEFQNGDVFHFWLTEFPSWTAGQVVRQGQRIEPTVPNGYVYEATRTDQPAAAWAPGVKRAVADVVEPTTANGYRYVVIETFGANPASGTTEPTWPVVAGAQVRESTEVAPPSAPTGSTVPGDDLPPDIRDRYGNRRDFFEVTP